MAFSQKNRTPLASIDLAAFNPIPLPFIAYVATAVSLIPLNYIILITASQLLNGLEEFKTGVEVTRDFSGPGYADYYTILMGSIKHMDAKDEWTSVLTDIRQQIFSSGRCAHFESLIYFLLTVVIPS